MESIISYAKQDEDDYYSILGCYELSSNDQILYEYKLRALHFHPDKNPEDPNAVQRFQKLQKAKDVLTDPVKRRIYDKWLNSGICMPFEQFINFSKSAHTSIHWACKKKEQMLEQPLHSDDVCSGTTENIEQKRNKQDISYTKISWESDAGSNLLRRFRNYEL